MTDTTACVIETKPQVWDLGGSMQVTIDNLTDPAAAPLTVHEGQDLRVKVTVTLTGRIRHYLCDTWLCVCLAYESCGSGPEGEFCSWLQLEGDNDPCKTSTFTFSFDVPGNTLSAGACGREYELCLTLGSKDCCGKVGFIFGTCKGVTITVLPKIES